MPPDFLTGSKIKILVAKLCSSSPALVFTTTSTNFEQLSVTYNLFAYLIICDHRRYRNAGWRHRVRTLPTGFSRGKTRSLTLPGVTYTVCCHKRRPLQDLLHISIVRESLIYFGGSLSICSPCAKH